MTAQERSVARALVAVGNPELERRLLEAFATAGINVVGRCLDGPTLVERAREPGVEVIVATADLHRLDGTAIGALRARRLPVVLLVSGATTERFVGAARTVLITEPVDVIASAVYEAAERGAAFTLVPEPGPTETSMAVGRAIGVTSGKGAPGKTTVAIALAATLGASGASVVLVDADLRGGNVAPYLDLDPRRGLVGLGGAGGEIAPRLAEELQAGPDCAVLAGLERPELTAALTPERVGEAIRSLRARFDWVVVDLGSEPAAGLHASVDELLVVTGADLVSCWNTRVALRGLADGAGDADVSLVVNRREGYEHYGGREITRALGLPVLGVVREDRRAARRATERQAPLSSVGGGAARDLRALARVLAARAEVDAAPASAKAQR